jgi:hypothetical protein
MASRDTGVQRSEQATTQTNHSFTEKKEGIPVPNFHNDSSSNYGSKYVCYDSREIAHTGRRWRNTKHNLEPDRQPVHYDLERAVNEESTCTNKPDVAVVEELR